jgi:hypothetical protein
MAAVLAGSGLGWTTTAGDVSHSVRVLLGAVVLGSVVYTLMLLVLWRLSGRPAGAEADGLAVAARLVRRLVGWQLRSPLKLS